VPCCETEDREEFTNRRKPCSVYLLALRITLSTDVLTSMCMSTLAAMITGGSVSMVLTALLMRNESVAVTGVFAYVA